MTKVFQYGIPLVRWYPNYDAYLVEMRRRRGRRRSAPAGSALFSVLRGGRDSRRCRVAKYSKHGHRRPQYWICQYKYLHYKVPSFRRA